MKRILVVLFAIVLFASCNRVSGTYVSDGGGLVEQIEFVGKNSCVITYFGMKLPASYRMDNGHIVADAGQNLIVMFKVLLVRASGTTQFIERASRSQTLRNQSHRLFWADGALIESLWLGLADIKAVKPSSLR